MAKVVVGLFDNFAHAQQAVNELVSNGFERSSISLIANPSTRRAAEAEGLEIEEDDVAAGATVGATSGALIGGAAGLIASLSALTIPVVGPILAAGPLVATLIGMGAGAVVGGLIGALVEAGVPEHEARLYEEGVRRGGTLVTVHASDDLASKAASIFNRHNVVDIRSRSEQWQSQPTPSQAAIEGAAPAMSVPMATGAPFDAPHLAGGPKYQGDNWNDQTPGETVRDMNRRKDSTSPTISSQPGEPLAHDSDFRSHFRTMFGANASFDEYSPAYQYGSRLANDQRYLGRDWTSIQSDARRDWESSHPNTWDKMKDAVQYGWNKVKAKVS